MSLFTEEGTGHVQKPQLKDIKKEHPNPLPLDQLKPIFEAAVNDPYTQQAFKGMKDTSASKDGFLYCIADEAKNEIIYVYVTRNNGTDSFSPTCEVTEILPLKEGKSVQERAKLSMPDSIKERNRLVTAFLSNTKMHDILAGKTQHQAVLQGIGVGGGIKLEVKPENTGWITKNFVKIGNFFEGVAGLYQAKLSQPASSIQQPVV